MNQMRLLLRQESILSLLYDQTFASECLAIASSSVDVLHSHLNSATYHPVDRFPATLYLVGSLLSLASISTGTHNSDEARREATSSFTKGFGMIKQMAPAFSTARHALQRLSSIAVKVQQVSVMFQAPRSDVAAGVPAQAPGLQDFGTDQGVAAGQDFDIFSQPLADFSWQPNDQFPFDAGMGSNDQSMLPAGEDIFGFDGSFALMSQLQ